MSPYQTVAQKLFFTKNDPNDLRLGDLVKAISPECISRTDSHCILGYPDDDGIKLSGGRPGASAGPDSIRQYLYRMTPPQLPFEFYDVGNLQLHPDLGARHETVKKSICSLQTKGIKTLSFGGGHDYGYADGSGFLQAHLGLGSHKPLILNFDAHLDVRPTTNGLSSGTPFYRLLNEYDNQFDFAEIGIQPQCNSIKHREWALNKKTRIFNLRDIEHDGGLMSLLKTPLFTTLTKASPVFVSFDIDCLSSSEAPGCSQSWITGLRTSDFLNFFSQLSKISSVKGLGIYEVSPPLDIQDQTSKTAALIAYHFLFQDIM